MIHNFLRLTRISLFIAIFGLFGSYFGTMTNVQAQKALPRAASAFSEPAATQQPLYSEYKGVRIGMSTDEVRAKLGPPTQVVEDQDFYVVTEAESVQILYDAAHRVAAISIDHLGDQGAPNYRGIVGADIDVKPDGSMYKLVRYEQLGFWVSFNRTAGVVPIITVTIQKIR